MTSTIDYASTARRAEAALTGALETWKNGLTTVTDRLQALPIPGTFPQVEATQAVERQFAFIKQIVDLNHEYARKLAEVADTLTGATRDQIQSVTGVVRDQVRGVSDAARSGVDSFEQSVREQADQAEEAQRQAQEAAEAAEREQAREAARAERQERKEANDKARQRYQSQSKVELAEEAGRRNLAKTGTVEELVQRLVEDDTK